MATGAVRGFDGRGRHTTTHRELILMPSGGFLLDTPGLRELQMWGGDEGFRESFQDVEQLASQCRFNDCRHQHEPGCEVRAAIERGELDRKRLVNYFKIKREYARVNHTPLSRKLQKAEKKRFAKKVRRKMQKRLGDDAAI